MPSSMADCGIQSGVPSTVGAMTFDAKERVTSRQSCHASSRQKVSESK